VNLPTTKHATLADYVGVDLGGRRIIKKIAELRLAPSHKVKTPILADFPVNIECKLERTIELDSHSMFIGLVQAIHADEELLDEQSDIDLERAEGLAYAWAAVRERPTYAFQVEELRRAIKQQQPGDT
jgi:flavin reductase (DIM6/NTAB) family NADH-FMN oxidoreductase RutF